MSLIYITGGARSGKSALAEQLAAPFGKRVLYIATARAFDEEMRARIQKHRARRPEAWGLYEGIDGFSQALDVAPDASGAGAEGAVAGTARYDCALLDCVPNLVTNLMMDSGHDWEHPGNASVQEMEARAMAALVELIDCARARSITVILVSGEVGMGLVPVYPFGRAFRDVLGQVNQRLAALSDEAFCCVSGIPVRLKG
ncbi:MAG: bifunctional adenosylcobinamide kinase/adenosylcobinamide-phosphate guanylyltransferase [Clostridia bacterium]